MCIYLIIVSKTQHSNRVSNKDNTCLYRSVDATAMAYAK